jgi:hypothetical protein
MYEIILEIPGVSGPDMMMDRDRPQEFQIAYRMTRHAFSQDASSIVIFVLMFSRDVAVAIVADKLYDLIKKHSTGKSEKMTIDRKTIFIDKGQIKKVIEEHITHEKK